MPILTGQRLKAALIFREKLLATLRAGAGKQSTPFRNSCCATAVHLIEVEKQRPLTQQESESFAQAIRGLRTTLPNAKMPLIMPRRDDRTAQQKANDEGIRAAYSADVPPSWSIQGDTWRHIVDTTIDPMTRRIADEILPDCPVLPRPGVAISMDHTRPPVDNVATPIIWQNGTRRGVLSKFISYFRDGQTAEL